MAFKKLVIASGQVSGASHGDFPILIQPSKMTGWEALTLAEAQSIRIYTDEAKTNEVAREVVSADEIHCKVPTLTSSTELYVDYDGVRSDYAVGATYGRNAVWGDYASVFHLNQHDTIINSTGSANGTGINTSSSDIISAQIGSGLNLNGKSLLLPCGQAGPLTMQMWVKTSESATFERATAEGDLSSFQSIRIRDISLDTRFFLRNGDSSQNVDFSVQANTQNNEWRLVHATSVDNLHSIFVDSEEEATNTQTHSPYATITTDFRLNDNYGSDTFSVDASYEEVRIRDSALSSNWITTEYNNQNDVASFWGTVTDAGGDPPEPVADTGFFAFM